MTILRYIGRPVLTSVREMGRMLIFLLSSFGWLARPPLRPARKVDYITCIQIDTPVIQGHRHKALEWDIS